MLGWYSHTMPIALLLCGCASAQLNYNTLDLASSTENLVTRQVLYNFANFLDNPAAIPAQVTISSGSATTSNSVTPTLTAPISTGVTTARLFATAPTRTVTDALTSNMLSVNASDSWNQSWAFAPITDPERMKRLQALYRYVVDWSDKGDSGGKDFVNNFPRIQRTISYSRPICLYGIDDKKKKPVELGVKTNGAVDQTATVCATAVGTGAGASRGATTESFAGQEDDPYYLRNQDCIVCGGKEGKHINKNLAGPWLHWRDLTGPNLDTARLPQPGDISLGRAGHYEFFASTMGAQKFVNFTVATLAAMSQGGSTSAPAASAQAAAGPKTVPALDQFGNTIQLFIPSQ
jgi:hypothetical protein